MPPLACMKADNNPHHGEACARAHPPTATKPPAALELSHWHALKLLEVDALWHVYNDARHGAGRNSSAGRLE